MSSRRVTKAELIKRVLAESEALELETTKPGGFSEYAQTCEDLLIELLPYLSIEGLRIAEETFIRNQKLRDGAAYTPPPLFVPIPKCTVCGVRPEFSGGLCSECGEGSLGKGG